MTRQKDLKRLVRARMQKTGEAYTAARANIIKKPITLAAAAAAAVPEPAVDYAKVAGMSDAVIAEKTGCSWERWTYALDRHKAYELSHADIAKLVKEKYKTDSWWTQTVTVGYERIKGLRTKGQQRNGTFGMTKSRTFNVPVDVLFEAWKNPRARKRWLDGERVRVRTSIPNKSMRLDWTDGAIVAVGFLAKGDGKSAVALEHSKLPDKETADRLKQYWSERLDALGAELQRE
ncbi:MAG: hypothetical protein V4550_04260 [Gemmatimonadota bacterium]